MISAAMLLCAFLLHVSAAQEVKCTVRSDGHLTRYSVEGVSGFDRPSCEWSWTHNSVLATHRGENDTLVKINQIDTLTTYKCFKNVTYELSCVPQGHRKAVCTTNCTLRRSQKDKEEKTTQISHHQIVAPVVAAVAVFGLVCFLCYKYKSGISMVPKLIYSHVKTNPEDEGTTLKMKMKTNPEDVEAGSE